MFGVLLDVSASMQSAYSLDTSQDASVERTHAIFTTVASIIRKEVTRHERQETIFVSAFGLSDWKHDTCDLLSLLTDLARSGHANLMEIAKKHGVAHVEYWIQKYLTDSEASLLYSALDDDPQLTEQFINLIPSQAAKLAVKARNRVSGGYERKLVHESAAYKRAMEVINEVKERSNPIVLQSDPGPLPTTIELPTTVELQGHSNLIALVAGNRASHVGSWIQKYLTESEAHLLYTALKDDSQLTQELINLIPSRVTKLAVRARSFFSGGGYEERLVRESAVYKRAQEIIANVRQRSKPVIQECTSQQHPRQAAVPQKPVIQQHVAQQHPRQAAVPQTSYSATCCSTASQASSGSTILSPVILKKHPKPKPVKEVSETFDILFKKQDPSSSSTSSSSSPSLHDEIQKLIKIIKPYIFGGTPMCKALRDAEKVFGEATTTGPKVLFVLADGGSNDGDPRIIAERLRESGVTIITCFLTSGAIDNPRCLFGPDQNFEKDDDALQDKQALFEMSSIMDNTHAPVSYLVDAGWELPTCGESRLFLQANSLDVVNEFCEIVVSQTTIDCNALVHLLEKVPLATYINQRNTEFEPKLQEGGTCYANAIAAVFHLAMSRIVGRDGGVPDFREIRKRIIDEYGVEGADTEKVLANVCLEYRLRYREVDETKARQAINERRPVVAIFWLYNGEQWKKLSSFYQRMPKEILKKDDIAVSAKTTRGGHAVVLMRCNQNCLTFMNSWGTKFADGGFFRVKDQKVLSDTRFFDVYWNIEDLKPCEIEAYERKCTQRAKEILEEFPSIKDLSHVCPRCNRGSKVGEFFGHILEVECPQCQHKFKPTNEALVQSLYRH